MTPCIATPGTSKHTPYTTLIAIFAPTIKIFSHGLPYYTTQKHALRHTLRLVLKQGGTIQDLKQGGTIQDLKQGGALYRMLEGGTIQDA